MQDTEIELQVRVEHIELLLNFLEKEARFQYESRQIDEYFTPSHRDFLGVSPIEEWLRLRVSGDSYSMTYKKWHFDEEQRGLYADEYETSLDNIEMARKIFNVIDARPIITVDKHRRVWMYDDYEIALDSVKGLGDFVEIEYKGKRDSSEHKEIMQEMTQFLKDVGCGKLETSNSGYPGLLLGGG